MSIFENIKDAVSVKQAAEYYGLNVNRSNMCCCPFHDDSTPSMKIYEKNYHCFGCGAHGDVIDFTARLFGTTQLEAAMLTGSFQRIETDKFFRYNLQNKLLMLDDDMQMSALPSTGYIKNLVTIPKVVTPEKEYYSIEEAQHLMELFNEESEENYKYVCFFILAIYTGFRLGELLGLEWKDVNFETNVITVNRTCLYSKAKGGLYTETPKTKQSMRSLKVPQGVIDMLKKWYDLQDKQRKKVGSKWIETDRIFTKWNGLTLDRTAPGYYYKRFCERTV